MSNFPKVILNSGKDLSLRRFHPWVFSGAIKSIEGAAQEGDVVEVYSNHDEYLGTGHCEPGSIAVRLFSFEKVDPDKNFWKQKIQQAFEYRKNIGITTQPGTNIYRLIFGEGDGLPGLIIDYYNGCCVIQAHSVGMYLARHAITDALKDIYGKELYAVYDKSSETLPKESEIEAVNEYLFQKETSTERGLIIENDHVFKVEWETGQKTGFFIDQRDNRALLAHYAKGKKILNTFCYTGGFSVYALKAGAELVHSVDSSKKAIELTDKNVALNFPKGASHESFAMDTFDFLKQNDHQYDIIILDPPAFAKHHNMKHNAVMGYKRLNTEAIQRIKPGGLIFTFSCSGVVDRKLFDSTVMSAAIVAGRKVRILHHLSQPADHPVNIFHTEGEYLKGLVLYVE